MCFTLYVAASKKLPLREWNKDKPGVHTANLQDYELGVLGRLSLPFALYVGSNQGCGCGFRHSIVDGQGWLPVIPSEKYELNAEQENHVGLWQYLTESLEGGSIEIYACWNSDVNECPDCIGHIRIEDITNSDFYFKEGWLYRMTI